APDASGALYGGRRPGMFYRLLKYVLLGPLLRLLKRRCPTSTPAPAFFRDGESASAFPGKQR
ncbi:hypothetical protein ABZY33_32135, partial [Streptomyces sp. NPDC006552]